jgi:hypothetical protein
MAVQFLSSMGKTYFVRQTLTKAGKVTYVCSTIASEADLKVLPEGMEFYESVKGKVTIRKKVVSKITDKEYQYVLQTSTRLAKPIGVKVELKKAAMVIYEVEKIKPPLFLKLAFTANPQAKLLEAFEKPEIAPSFRVTLKDNKTRRFIIERRYYLSPKDEWLFLEEGDLKALIKRYAPHIGKDSFFELS